MYQNSNRTLRKQSSDNKHHHFQILSQIKDYISKKRFNHAYEMGSKYYEQNKTILTNEEIYQLCFNCCRAIQNKITHRLTIKKKKYVPPITQSHLQHLFSLQLTLHSLLLPEIIKLNEKYFNMLEVQNEGINPRQISAQQIAFQRKNKDYFLDNNKLKKEMKRQIKQHLKICNAVLMYRINHRKNKNEIKELFEVTEQIYQHFEEHDFPSEHMDYILIKLSLIQVERSSQGIPYSYRLPLGFLSKLYQKMRKDNQDAIEHYLNKLTSFFVLTFKHLPLSIQDMFILTSEVQYITKILSDKYDEVLSKGHSFNKNVGKNVKRLVTIDKQPSEESLHRLSKREGSVSTFNKLSEKKVESKRNIRHTYSILTNLSQLAIEQIDYSMNCRRQVIEIVLRYFNLSYLQKNRDKDSEDIISNEVLLNASSRNNRKKNNNKQQFQGGLSSQKRTRRNHKTLTSMLRDIKIQKKSSSVEQCNEVQKVKFHTTMKEKGKFIIKNIGLVSRQTQLKIGYYNVVNNLLNSVANYQRDIQLQDSNFDKEDILQDFQLDRLAKIKVFKDKLRAKIRYERNIRDSKEQQIYQIPAIKQKQPKKINLLKDVVQENIIKSLQLPFNQIGIKNRSYSSPIFKKLEALKQQAQNLNTQRKYLAQKFIARKAICLSQCKIKMTKGQNILTEKEFKKEKENLEEISKFSQHFTQKIDKYIQGNKKLMMIEKNAKSSFKIKVMEKPYMKLKLETKVSKKLPEMTFQKLQQEYNKLEGNLQKEKVEWQMTLSSQFDKLRRDAAKNQFSTQNQRRQKSQTIKNSTKQNNNTINQIALDDQQQQFY